MMEPVLPTGPRSSALAGYLLLAIVVALNAGGNLLLKIGANQAAGRPLLGLLSWASFAGLACFGTAILAYLVALRQLPLHIAQMSVSTQYVLTILLASWVLGEQVSAQQWLGLVLIVSGLYLCLR
jgi:undecaprenyl phosphate-alpha-L-ara4N flippase subunit ArnE